MQSLFELKAKMPIDSNVYENMRKTAAALLHDAERGQYTQAIVLYSATGHEYSVSVKNALSDEKTDETALLEKLQKANDTEIRYVLCTWQDGGIDVPSFGFRDMLCKQDPLNSDAIAFVMTANGVSGVKISETMK